MQIAAEHGDDRLYDALFAAAARAGSPDERQRYLFATTAFRDPAIIERALQRTFSSDVRTQDTARYLASFFDNPVARPARMVVHQVQLDHPRAAAQDLQRPRHARQRAGVVLRRRHARRHQGVLRDQQSAGHGGRAESDDRANQQLHRPAGEADKTRQRLAGLSPVTQRQPRRHDAGHYVRLTTKHTETIFRSDCARLNQYRENVHPERAEIAETEVAVSSRQSAVSSRQSAVARVVPLVRNRRHTCDAVGLPRRPTGPARRIADERSSRIKGLFVLRSDVPPAALRRRVARLCGLSELCVDRRCHY